MFYLHLKCQEELESVGNTYGTCDGSTLVLFYSHFLRKKNITYLKYILGYS